MKIKTLSLANLQMCAKIHSLLLKMPFRMEFKLVFIFLSFLLSSLTEANIGEQLKDVTKIDEEREVPFLLSVSSGKFNLFYSRRHKSRHLTLEPCKGTR